MSIAHACPACHPGDYPAEWPVAAEPAPGGTLATYEHRACGSAWRVLWDRDGWPVSIYVQVTPQEAARNRAALELAIRFPPDLCAAHVRHTPHTSIATASSTGKE